MSSYATVFADQPFTARQAADVGLTRSALWRLRQGGGVRRLLTDVYVDASVPDALDLRVAALALVVPADAVVCLRAAAWVWGVDALRMGAHLAVPPVDVLRPAGRSASRRTGVAGRSGALPDGDAVTLCGIQVTTPVRTAVDLGRLLCRPDALAALDAMRRLPGLDPVTLAAAVERFGRHRGVVQARELAGLADPRSESAMESRTRLRARDAGFPPFEPQVEVFDPAGAFVARLDLGRRAERKAIEYDGDQAHGSAPQQRHDHVRRRRAEGCGWGIAVVTGGQVLSRALLFEYGVAELLGVAFRLSPNHPRYGGWDSQPWAA
ncbi:MAG: hypothetical protein ACRDV1_12215 [Actinomycetes bacterium]